MTEQVLSWRKAPIFVENMRFQNYLVPFGRGVRVYSQLHHGFNWQKVNEIGTWLTNQALVVQKVDDAMHWMNPVVRQYLLNIRIITMVGDFRKLSWAFRGSFSSVNKLVNY